MRSTFGVFAKKMALGAAVLAASAAVPCAAENTTATWDNSVGVWSSTSSWSIAPLFPNNGSPPGSLYDVTINGGTVSVDVGVVISNLVLSGGSISGSQDLTVNGLLSWGNSSTLGGSGTLTTQDMAISLINANIFMSGTRALVSTGNTSWTSNSAFSVNLASGNSYTNQGTFTISTNGGSWNGGTFSNAGALVKGGNDSVDINSIFNNSGSVTVSAGTLNLNGGGTHTGSFILTGTGAINFSATHNFNAGASFTAANATFSSGTLNFNTGSSLSISGTFTSGGGAFITWNTGHTQTFTNFVAGSSTIQGTEAISVSNLFTWSGATFVGSGDVTTKDLAVSLFNVNNSMNGTRNLTSTGAATWTSNSSFNVSFAAANTYTNAGTFTISTTGGPSWTGGTFNNVGTLTQTSSDSVNIGSVFNNSGSVSASVGTLMFSGGGTQTGSFTATGTGVIAFAGTHNFNAGASYTATDATFASGTLNFNAGSSLTLSGTFTTGSGASISLSTGQTKTFANFVAGSSTIQGTDAINVSNLLTWNGATFAGSGAITTKDLAVVLINVNNSLNGTRNLTSTGAATWTSNSSFNVSLAAGNTYTNAGTFTISTTGGPSWTGGVFLNTGTLTQTSGDTPSIGSEFDNSGLVSITAGTLTLGGGGTHTGSFSTTGAGALSFAGTHTFQSGSTVNTSNIVFGSGTMNFSAGSHLSVPGTFTESGATLNLNTGATLSVNSLFASAGLFQGSDLVTVSNLLTWNGTTFAGSGAITTKDLAISLFNVNNTMSGSRSLTSTGATTWTSNSSFSLTLGAANTYTNQGSFTINTTGGPSWNGGTFNNPGALSKISSDTVTISALFNNSGSVAVSAGTLSLAGGGNQTGSFVTSGAGAVAFGGNNTFQASSTITSNNVSFFASGAGGIGTFLAGSALHTANIDFSSGSITFNPGSVLTASTVGVSGATVDLSTGTPGSFTNLSATNGTLQGADSITVTNLVTWAGGTFAGAAPILTKDLTIPLVNVNNTMSGSRTLTSTGAATWTSNSSFSVNLSAANTYTNAGTFTINTTGGPSWNGGIFNNAGSLSKISSDLATISSLFNNSGAVAVSGGQLTLSGGGTHTGSFAVTGTGALAFSGTHAFNAGSSILADTVNFVGGASTFNSGAALSVGNLVASSTTLTFNTGTTDSFGTFTGNGGTLQGADNLNVTGTFTWSGINLNSSGTLTTRDLAIPLINLNNSMTGSGSLVSTGAATWTSNAGFTVNLAAGNTYTNKGTFTIDTVSGAGWNGGAFNNNGLLLKNSSDTNVMTVAFSNLGTVTVSAGNLTFAGSVSNLATVGAVTTLTGGTWNVLGSTLVLSAGNDITTNAASVFLSGSSAQFSRFTSALSTNNGDVHFLLGNVFSGSTDFTNNGQIEVRGATFGAPSLLINSAGTLFGFGNVNVRPTNKGTIRAAGGSLVFSSGILGASGTLKVDPDGSLNVAGGASDSSTDFLLVNSTLPNSLVLGSNNLLVKQSYTNAGFGVGNAFNKHAGVSATLSATTGRILADGDNAQLLTGNVINGITVSPIIDFGHIHVGDAVSRSFQIQNGGATGGPAVLFALQTGVNGGNITDARLSGTGVAAGNVGPAAYNASSGPLDISFTGSVDGALVAQALHIANNFDNLPEQTVSLSGAAFNFAQAVVSGTTVNFGNHHVGDVVNPIAVSIKNNAPADGFSEKLDALVSNISGSLSITGGVNLLNPQLTDNTSVLLNFSASSPGAKTGSGTLLLVSDGQAPGTLDNSGLGQTSLPSIALSSAGAVFRLATPSLTGSPLNFGNHHVGETVNGSFTLRNLDPNDGFSENLDALVTNPSGVNLITGAISGLVAGASSSLLSAHLDTSSAGHKTGSATLTLTSDGSGTSGLTNTALVSVGLSALGDVFRLAAPLVTSNPINFGNHHVGESVSAAVSVQNSSTADGFSEKLDASLTNVVGPNVFAGSASLLGAGATSTGIGASLDTSSAGNKAGSATLNLVSDGTGTSGLSNTTLSSVSLSATGTVFRLAAPIVTGASIDFGNHHVGDNVTNSVSLQNGATADGFSEKLDAFLSNVVGPNLFSGSASLIAAGASSTNVGTSLDTSLAGAKTGSATLNLVSDGTGTSGLGNTGLLSIALTASGNVFNLAQAGAVPNIDLGIIHVGDDGTRALTISNNAPAAFSENLRASFGSSSGAASTSGGPVTVSPQSSSNNLHITLDTSSAATHQSGTALLQFSSDGTGSSNLGLSPLPGAAVTITADVLNFAHANLQKNSGNGVLTLSTNSALLDFGALASGTAVSATLSALNDALGPADTLAGTWSINAPDFLITNFNSFNGIAAGQALGNLQISFSSTTPGVHTGTIVLHPLSQDAAPFSAPLSDFTFTVSATVNPVAAPEPGSLVALMVSVPALLFRCRRAGADC